MESVLITSNQIELLIWPLRNTSLDAYLSLHSSTEIQILAVFYLLYLAKVNQFFERQELSSFSSSLLVGW